MTEIAVLAWGGLLAAVQLVALSVVANREMDSAWLASARDDDRARPTLTGRLSRALTNMVEALAFYAPAAIALTLMETSSAFTGACAVVWLIARIAYVPLYALGTAYYRSAVWAIGFVATLAMLIAAVL